MIRHLGITLTTLACMVAFLAAQERTALREQTPAREDQVENKRDAKDKETPKKSRLDDLKKEVLKEVEPKGKDGKKAEPGWEEPAQGADKIKEIVNRINENMEKSGEKLAKKDPGEQTHKIQDQIIKDLDELIKQQQNNKGGGGGGGGGASSSSKGSKGSSGKSSSSSSSSSGNSGSSGSKSSAQNNKGGQDKSGQDKGGQAKNDKGGGKDGKDKGLGKLDDKKDGKDKGGLGKGDGKDKDKGGLGKKDDKGGKDGKDLAKGGGKDGKGGDGMGGGDSKKNGKNTIADLYRDVWGHLPEKKRQEMDVYLKQRFLPKYEDLLRQYYRTISEQGRKDGD